MARLRAMSYLDGEEPSGLCGARAGAGVRGAGWRSALAVWTGAGGRCGRVDSFGIAPNLEIAITFILYPE